MSGVRGASVSRRLWLTEPIAYRPLWSPQLTPTSPKLPDHMRLAMGWIDEARLRQSAGDDVVDHLLNVKILRETNE